MGVINSPLVEGGVFSEEVNKKEVTVNGVNKLTKRVMRITYNIAHSFCYNIFIVIYRKLYSSL